ncbi:MAG: alpha/beta hydrolase [Gordonia sp. (in: high G+C Gram-positive bacteria)]|uniref:alpha/beta fold hydrolase n=1 Tax=Gordonia sp. (in: high G+C Gram-positive bacteria) TaxID=84139 RepID=UPI0039E4049A
MPLPRSRAALALAAAGVLALTGCTAGPDVGPGIVRGDNPGGGTSKTQLPGIAAPQHDLKYSSCGSKLSGYGVDVPSAVKVACARLSVPVDPKDQGGDDLRLGIVKVSTSATPSAAAPIVLVTGSDLPASRLALLFADDQIRPLVDRHPIVAVDRRGIGLSAPVDCLTKDQRTTLTNDAASGDRDVQDRVTALAASARQGADICNDTLEPNQLEYSVSAAAADLETLRTTWGVDRLALLGVGSGSSVALAYQAAHPDQVGRLILDSPVGFNTQATDAAQARADGLQNTLAAFASRCSAAGCSLGADGIAMIGRVVQAGAAGTLPGLSDTAILTAVTTALAVGDTGTAGLKKLADAISKADGGDAGPLRALADTGRDLRASDGQLVSACNDLVGRPGLDELPSMAKDWSKDAPITATGAALGLARCDGWGVADAATAPTGFPVAPLVFVGADDPVNGAKAAEGLTPLLITAGANANTVSWDGLGYSVVAHSDCAVRTVVEYLGSEPLSGAGERVCPS